MFVVHGGGGDSIWDRHHYTDSRGVNAGCGPDWDVGLAGGLTVARPGFGMGSGVKQGAIHFALIPGHFRSIAAICTASYSPLSRPYSAS